MWISSEEKTIGVRVSASLLMALFLAGGSLYADEGQAEGAVSEASTAKDKESPGDEEWFYDMERDRRYRVEAIRRVEHAYKWVDETHVRLVLGLVHEVVEYDDEWFWVKVWEPGPPMKPRPRVNRPPTEEMMAEAAAKYATDVEHVDRLHLEAYDEGLPRTGQWRNGFDLADVNGDGHLDIVFGPSRKGTPRPNLFLGDGAGGWKRWAEASFPRLPYDYGDAAAADFNGDGFMDLAFGVHLRGLIALIGDGKGSFEPWMDGIAIEMPGKGGDASSFSSRAIEAIDWDGDGRVDILALGEGPKGTQLKEGADSRPLIDSARGFALFRNLGDGSWENVRLEEEPYDFGDNFAIGDVTGNGMTDLVVASRIHGNRWPVKTGADGEKMGYAELTGVRPGTLLSAVETADFNGDGRADLVAAYLGKELGVWRTGLDLLLASDGDEEWDRESLFVVEVRNGIRSIATGDLDADGHLDIVASTGDGALLAYLGDGKGGFVREAMPEAPPQATNCTGWEIRLANLDDRPGDEILVSYAGEDSGMPGLAGLHLKGCERGGSLRAWSPVPAE